MTNLQIINRKLRAHTGLSASQISASIHGSFSSVVIGHDDLPLVWLVKLCTYLHENDPWFAPTLRPLTMWTLDGSIVLNWGL